MCRSIYSLSLVGVPCTRVEYLCAKFQRLFFRRKLGHFQMNNSGSKNPPGNPMPMSMQPPLQPLLILFINWPNINVTPKKHTTNKRRTIPHPCRIIASPSLSLSMCSGNSSLKSFQLLFRWRNSASRYSWNLGSKCFLGAILWCNTATTDIRVSKTT